MHGFRRTLFLSHLGLVALTTLLLLFTLRGLATRFFSEQLRDKLLSQSSFVRRLVEPAIDSEGFSSELPPQNVRDLVSEIRNKANTEKLRIRIINRDGKSILDTYTVKGEAPELGWSFADRPEVKAALQGETNSVVRGQLRDGSSAMFLAMPVRRDGEILGCVYTTSAVLIMTPTITSYVRRLGLVILAVLVVAALISIALAQRLALPARRLEEATRRLAAGDMTARVAMHRRFLGRGDEMDKLTREFNAMAAQIEQTDEERRTFLADVSHELRTPLTSIKGSAETLRDGAWRNDQMAPRFAATIVEQSDRMIRLVGDLLKLARLENTLPVIDDRLDAEALCNRVTYTVNPIFERCRVRLVTECKTPRIQGNADLLDQVLINLLVNAARHSPPDSTTTLSVQREGSEAILQVRDEGRGIAPEHLPKLGQRFYRVEEGRARDSGGSGLGLAVCRRIVVAHDGTMEIQSEVGKGTVVEVRLPYRRDTAPLVDTATGGQPPGTASQNGSTPNGSTGKTTRGPVVTSPSVKA
jgi:signal transduction histidine kinase